MIGVTAGEARLFMDHRVGIGRSELAAFGCVACLLSSPSIGRATPFVFTFDTPGTSGGASGNVHLPPTYPIPLNYSLFFSTGGNPGGYIGNEGGVVFSTQPYFLELQVVLGGAVVPGAIFGLSDYGATVSFDYLLQVSGPSGSFGNSIFEAAYSGYSPTTLDWTFAASQNIGTWTHYSTTLNCSNFPQLSCDPAIGGSQLHSFVTFDLQIGTQTFGPISNNAPVDVSIGIDNLAITGDPTPEPGTMALCLLGFGGLLLRIAVSARGVRT
jgi:hypothetical protein